MHLVDCFGGWIALSWVAAVVAPCLLVCVVACALDGRRARRAADVLGALPVFALPPLPALEQPKREDPLEAIEGIEPEFADLLRDEGIHTFDHLARLGTAHLRAVVHARGSKRVGTVDPASWAFQADLLARGQFEAFADLVKTLEGGRVRLESICEPSRARRLDRDGESTLMRAVRAAGVHGIDALAQWQEVQALARAANVPVSRVHAWIAQADLLEHGDAESYTGLIEPAIVARMGGVAAPYPLTNDYRVAIDERTTAYSQAVAGEIGVAIARWREAALRPLLREADRAGLSCGWIAAIGALALASLIGLWLAGKRPPCCCRQAVFHPEPPADRRAGKTIAFGNERPGAPRAW